MSNFNSANFHDSVNPSSNISSSLSDIAATYSIADGFVPCWSGSDGDKKIPCRGADGWQDGSIDKRDVMTFNSMTMLGLVLGDKYIALDADGISAIALATQYFPSLPDTLQISSELGVRHCWIFEIPEALQGTLRPFKESTGQREQLEFRTGKQYQIIAGIHPKTKAPYQTNAAPILDIPPEVVALWLAKTNKTQVASVENTQLQIKTLGITTSEVETAPSLFIFVSQDTKQFLRYGAFTGGRNDSSFAAACDLIGTALRLDILNIPYQGTAEGLYNEAYAKFSDTEGFSEREFNRVFISASTAERTIVKEDEKLLKLVNIWVEECVDGGDFEEIEDRVVAKSAKLFKQTKKEMIAAFKLQTPFPTKVEAVTEARRIYNELGFKGFCNDADNIVLQEILKALEESEPSADEVKILRGQVAKIKKDKQQKIQIDPILAKYDSKPTAIKHIITQSRIKEMDDSNTLVSFYTVLSSLLPKQLHFKWNASGRSRPNIFTVIVAPPTYGKDEIFRPITNDLHNLSVDSNNRYDDAKRRQKQLLEDWKGLDKEQQKNAITEYAIARKQFPDEMTPSQKRECWLLLNNSALEVKQSHPYVSNMPTMQALSKAAGQHKDFGLLINPSELADFISNFNRVNKDKNGASGLIKIWNGDSTLSELKTEDLQQEADFFQCSLLSGIQPQRFKEYLNAADESGIGARLLYLNIADPIFIPTVSFESDEDNQASFDLKEFYLKFQSTIQGLLPETTEMVNGVAQTKKLDYVIGFQKDSEAIRVLDGFRRSCEEKARMQMHSNSAAFQWYRRLAENVVKFSLVIQCLRFYEGLETDMKYISEDSISEAVAIGDFLEKQFLAISETLSGNSTQVPDEFLHRYEKMLTTCKRVMDKKQKTSISSSDLAGDALLRRKEFLDAYGSPNSKQLNKTEVHTCWQEMHKLGLVIFDKSTGKLNLVAN